MATQTIEQKAWVYLAEGRIRVQALGVGMAVLEARGSGPKPYSVTYAQGVWSCSCPAHVVECAHVVAAQLVTPESFVDQPVAGALGEVNEALDALFDKEAPIESLLEWPDA